MNCPKCHGAMEPGFLPDFTYGAIIPSSWIEGTPEKNWIGSTKIKDKRKIAISTLRCVKCGFLELYAKS